MGRNANDVKLIKSCANACHKFISFAVIQIVINKHQIKFSPLQEFACLGNCRHNGHLVCRQELGNYLGGKY